MRAFLREFKEFISAGNLIELAVAFILGLAIKAVIDAFIQGVANPIIGAIFGKPNLGTDFVGGTEIVICRQLRRKAASYLGFNGLSFMACPRLRLPLRTVGPVRVLRHGAAFIHVHHRPRPLCIALFHPRDAEAGSLNKRSDRPVEMAAAADALPDRR